MGRAPHQGGWGLPAAKDLALARAVLAELGIAPPGRARSSRGSPAASGACSSWRGAAGPGAWPPPARRAHRLPRPAAPGPGARAGAGAGPARAHRHRRPPRPEPRRGLRRRGAPPPATAGCWGRAPPPSCWTPSGWASSMASAWPRRAPRPGTASSPRGGGDERAAPLLGPRRLGRSARRGVWPRCSALVHTAPEHTPPAMRVSLVEERHGRPPAPSEGSTSPASPVPEGGGQSCPLDADRSNRPRRRSRSPPLRGERCARTSAGRLRRPVVTRMPNRPRPQRQLAPRQEDVWALGVPGAGGDATAGAAAQQTPAAGAGPGPGSPGRRHRDGQRERGVAPRRASAAAGLVRGAMRARLGGPALSPRRARRPAPFLPRRLRPTERTSVCSGPPVRSVLDRPRRGTVSSPARCPSPRAGLLHRRGSLPHAVESPNGMRSAHSTPGASGTDGALRLRHLRLVRATGPGAAPSSAPCPRR